MADLKITQLTALTTPDVADLLPIVDDVAGTPITKKITLASIGIPKIVYKSADETVNGSDVMQDDDHLVLPVLANEVWAFRAVWLVSSGSTPDFKYQFTYPSGATISWFDAHWNDDRYDADVTNANTSGGKDVITLTGTIFISSTPGNIQLQWAQNTSNASDTKVLKGSHIIAHRLA